MAPKYRLIYFNLRARGEAIRWIFHYAGQEFEDHRVERANWVAIKPTTPMGTVPYLEVDGKMLSGSMPIARYQARNFGLAGQDAWEEAEADAVVGYVQDANEGWVSWVKAMMRDKDEKKAASIKESYLAEGVIPYLQGLELKLQKNDQGKGFVVGKEVAWADIVLVTVMDQFVRWKSDVLEGYPLLKAHSDRVHNLKGIREWLAVRPDTGVL